MVTARPSTEGRALQRDPVEMLRQGETIGIAQLDEMECLLIAPVTTLDVPRQPWRRALSGSFISMRCSSPSSSARRGRAAIDDDATRRNLDAAAGRASAATYFSGPPGNPCVRASPWRRLHVAFKPPNAIVRGRKHCRAKNVPTFTYTGFAELAKSKERLVKAMHNQSRCPLRHLSTRRAPPRDARL